MYSLHETKYDLRFEFSDIGNVSVVLKELTLGIMVLNAESISIWAIWLSLSDSRPMVVVDASFALLLPSGQARNYKIH